MAKHGTLARYVTGKCRCQECTASAVTYDNHRRRQVAYGRWQPFVDAEPVRRHVRDLMAFGIGWQKVARLAGVSEFAVSMLLYGSPGAGRPQTGKLRPETARKLLAVTRSLDNVSKWVDAAGTRRRLQALAVSGWSSTRLAPMLGVGDQTVSMLTSGQRRLVTGATARAVARLYDELWDQKPPARTKSERQSVKLAQRRAAEHGWLPAVVWDDDLIDLSDDELAAAISRQAQHMTDEELASCNTAYYKHGDLSPLTAAGAREYGRRARQRAKERNLAEAS
jgi:hypothetical protein